MPRNKHKNSKYNANSHENNTSDIDERNAISDIEENNTQSV